MALNALTQDEIYLVIGVYAKDDGLVINATLADVDEGCCPAKELVCKLSHDALLEFRGPHVVGSLEILPRSPSRWNMCSKSSADGTAATL